MSPTQTLVAPAILRYPTGLPRLAIELAPEQPWLGARGLPSGSASMPLHRGEIDDKAIVADGAPGRHCARSELNPAS